MAKGKNRPIESKRTDERVHHHRLSVLFHAEGKGAKNEMVWLTKTILSEQAFRIVLKPFDLHRPSNLLGSPLGPVLHSGVVKLSNELLMKIL